jgi:hypothetical protein
VGLLSQARLDGHISGYRTDGSLPATFVFKTREGSMGLLQITGMSDSPPGMKIRYKLVQTPAITPTLPPGYQQGQGVSPAPGYQQGQPVPLPPGYERGQEVLLPPAYKPVQPSTELKPHGPFRPAGESKENSSPPDNTGLFRAGTTIRAAGGKVILDSPNAKLTADQMELGASNALTISGSDVTYELRGKPTPK